MLKLYKVYCLRHKILLDSSVFKSIKVVSNAFHTHQKKLSEDVQNKTHFGNKFVTMDEKKEKVRDVFDNVASKYDLMNDLMSGGVHRVWKDIFISRLAPKPGIKLLDVAGGTGDITFRVLQYIHNQLNQDHFSIKGTSQFGLTPDTESVDDKEEFGKESEIVVCDLSEKMLNVGRTRARSLNITDRIEWVAGDAQELPFADATFDAYVIAFGMRNVPDVQKALDEAYRVLKVGGRFLCLEFSQVKSPFLSRLYGAYSFEVIPVMGQLVAADWDSYQYLVESIRKFPVQAEFKGMIEDAGFRKVKFENLTFGVVSIHSGFKI